MFYALFTNNRVYRYDGGWSEVPGSTGARAISYAGGTLYIAYSGGIWTYHPASGDWSQSAVAGSGEESAIEAIDSQSFFSLYPGGVYSYDEGWEYIPDSMSTLDIAHGR